MQPILQNLTGSGDGTPKMLTVDTDQLPGNDWMEAI